MNASKLTLLVVAFVAIPTVASAQIVIERLNETADPSAPVIKKDKKKDKGKAKGKAKAGEEEDEEAEVEVEETFTAEETQAMEAVFLKQLTAAHTTCLSGPTVRRPYLADVTGSATWTIREDGRAKFSNGTATPTTAMFFKDQKQLDAIPPAERAAGEKQVIAAYGACIKLESAKVPVEDKTGEFTLDYTVTWNKGKAVVALGAGGGGGGEGGGGDEALDLDL